MNFLLHFAITNNVFFSHVDIWAPEKAATSKEINLS